MRIPQQAQRDPPIGDAAFGIGFQRILVGHLRGAVPERMLVQHRPVEMLLRLRLARCLEMDFAELAVIALPAGRRCGAKSQRDRDGGCRPWLLPWRCCPADAAVGRENLGAAGREVISEKRDFYRRPCYLWQAWKPMLDRTLTFGRYRLDPRGGLTSGAREVRLTPKALSLALLHRRPPRRGRPARRNCSARSGRRRPSAMPALVTCIQELRKALRDCARKPRYIETLHRRGYRFIAKPAPESSPAATDRRGVRPAAAAASSFDRRAAVRQHQRATLDQGALR